MSSLALRNISKIYPNNNCVVKNFNLEIQDQEFIIFVGPSGCGKSTTLRMIAGLEEISGGELWMDGKLMNYVEPQKREMAMVLQNYALYPHMTVYGNMAYALKIRKVPKREIDKRVHEVARILEIEHLLDRRPGELSGGQRQRVAIGSAMIREPRVFLMDEPLSNLDAKLRVQMRVEIAKLHERLGTTIIYVTHDQTEAMTLGTRIVVMKEGVIQQTAAPAVLYNNPINQFVAGFIGSPAMNFFKTHLFEREGKKYITVRDWELPLSDSQSFLLKKRGFEEGEINLGIRPEDVLSTLEVKEAAVWKFVEFLVSPESQAYWNSQTGYFPVNTKAQDEDAFKENIAKYPQFQTALDQLHDSAPQYAGALLSVFPEARQIVQQQIENMLNGQATPEEAAAEMASQINSSIEEYNLVNE